MKGTFWQKNCLITDILFELQPIIIFSPVANFGDQSLITETLFFLFGTTDDNVSVTSSIVSHDTDSEIEELESLDKVLRRGTRGRAMLQATRKSRRFEETPEKTSSEEEDEESDFENTTLGDRVKRKMRVEATGSSKRSRVNYR